ACQPKQANRVFGECVSHMSEHAVAQVVEAAARVHQRTIGMSRNGVDSEITTAQVVFQRDVCTGIEGKSLVATPRFPFGTGQREFLLAAWMQEDREVAAHRNKAAGRH